MTTTHPGNSKADSFADNLFWWLLAGTGAIKLVFAALVPLTGDEAYFVTWGRHLDYGYYDHGAMTGWWLWAMLHLGDSTWIVRLPAVLTPLAVGWALRRMLLPFDREKASLAAGLFLLSPVNVANFFITTDTPLLLFSMLAAVWAWRAVRRESALDWFVAGLFLGLAFLSKYFAVLLGLSFAVFAVFRHGWRGWKPVAALLAGVIPSAALNVAWNVNHSWTNILFNVLNRNSDARLSLLTPLELLASAALLAGPGLLVFLLRRRVDGRLPWTEAWRRMQATGADVFFFALLVPGSVLFLVSLGQNVRLHWLVSFFPLLFPLLAIGFDAPALRRMLRPAGAYAGFLVALVAVALMLPITLLQSSRSYPSIVLGTHPDEVIAALAPYRERYLLTTPSYSKSALLEYHSGSRVPVLGFGSHHARQDDFHTDFRALDGGDIMVLANRPDQREAAARWFRETEVRTVEVRGASISLLLGRGFRYETYRSEVLQAVADRYYRMPPWLAGIARPSFFLERYGLSQPPAPASS